ncbi:MAG: hypothetical protein SO053_08700 [Bifidobacterium animalis]|nr:hypothetical protein [Bifidobacterium animalis]MDY5041204.1 hypothetical protein [Bifidobacterium animalis]
MSDWKGSLQNDDLSDFERNVLERAVSTGSITQDDYEQAYTKYLQCMTNAGYDQLKYTKMPDGLYRLSNEAKTDEGYFDQSVQCSDGTIRVIEAAYRDQQDNPERYKDSGIIAAQCLRDAKIVDDTYTAAQFNEASQRYLNGDETDPSDLFGFPITGSNQQTLYCLALGGVGLAIEDDAS